MPPPKKKGYVEDPAIRKMRVQAWFKAVSLASGMTTAELEREFSDGKAKGTKIKRSCIWDKYRRGEALPRSGRKTSGELNLVERVEARFPGTAKWLNSPLWRLVDKAPMEMSDIRGIYEGMPSMLRPLFLAPPSETPCMFWRRPLSHGKTYQTLARLGTLDALIAALAMMKEAEVTQNQDQYYSGVTTARQILTAQFNTQLLDGPVFKRLVTFLAATSPV